MLWLYNILGMTYNSIYGWCGMQPCSAWNPISLSVITRYNITHNQNLTVHATLCTFFPTSSHVGHWIPLDLFVELHNLVFDLMFQYIWWWEVHNRLRYPIQLIMIKKINLIFAIPNPNLFQPRYLVLRLSWWDWWKENALQNLNALQAKRKFRTRSN